MMKINDGAAITLEVMAIIGIYLLMKTNVI
jgi:hypothetical protein